MPCLSGFELYSRWVSLIYICQKVQRVIVKSSQRVGVLQLFKATILPYSTYSHLIWHFGRASYSRKLDRVLGRVLRAICYDRSSTYEKLLNMANLCTLRNQRLQDMAGLMYKFKNNICPKYIADLFQRTDTKYPLRNKEFVIPRFNTITHGKHFVRYIGSKLWNLLP